MKGDPVLKEIEELAQKQFLPIVGPEKGKVLEKIVRMKKPMTVLEIGTLVGYSAVRILRNLSHGAKLICMDINPRLAKIAEQNIKHAGFDNFEIRVGDAKQIIPTLKNKFDFVFIDALKEEYMDYLKAVEKKLNNNATIVADNAGVFAEEMEEYLDYVRTSKKYKTKTYQVYGDAMEVSVRV